MTSATIGKLSVLWDELFAKEKFVGFESGFETAKIPADFLQAISEQADQKRAQLVNDWIPACAEIVKNHFFEERAKYDLEKLKFHDESEEKEKDISDIIKFFDCVASLMQLQVRKLVKESLEELLEFLLTYKDPKILSGGFLFIFK